MRELGGLAIVLAGCYSPSAAVGVPCGSMGECPTGQHCDFTVAPPTCAIADARPIDAAPDAPPTCATNANCATTAPVCDSITNTCRGCFADTECGTDICLEYTGQCANASNTLFVATPGASNGSCPRSAPCTFSYAITQVAQNRRTIAIADGMYTTQLLIPSNLNANQLIVSGPDIDPAGVVVRVANGAGMFVENSTKEILVEGISFIGGLGSGIENRGTLTLSRVHADGNTDHGIVSTNPNSLAIWDCRFSQNGRHGIDTMGTPLEVLRSHILSNLGGGLEISNAATTIENSVIADNGSTTVSIGGLRFQNLQASAVQVFRFNTVANNVAMAGTEHGVICPIAMTLDSSIFVDGAGVAPVSSSCSTTYSLFSISPPPTGMGNITGDPMFVAAGANDFHISAASPARDAANPAATTGEDIDRERRPNGMYRDIGADEAP